MEIKQGNLKWTNPLSVTFKGYTIKAEEIIGFYEKPDEARELVKNKLGCKDNELIMFFDVVGISSGFLFIPTTKIRSQFYRTVPISLTQDISTQDIGLRFAKEEKVYEVLFDSVRSFDRFVLNLMRLFVKLAQHEDNRLLSDRGVIDISSVLDFVNSDGGFYTKFSKKKRGFAK